VRQFEFPLLTLALSKLGAEMKGKKVLLFALRPRASLGAKKRCCGAARGVNREGPSRLHERTLVFTQPRPEPDVADVSVSDRYSV
jgi:hypothetical protein